MRSVVVWLRGGNASYTFHGPKGSVGDVNVHLTSVTANNGTVFAPRSFNANTRDGQINPKYPIRNSSILYDNNSRVWSAGNDGSGSGLDADLLDGHDGSTYIGKAGNSYYQHNTWIQGSGAYEIGRARSEHAAKTLYTFERSDTTAPVQQGS